MNKPDCEMSVGFDTRPLLDAIAKNMEVDFLTPSSKPDSVDQVMQASHYILKSIAKSLDEAAREPKHLAHFARALGFHKFIDEEQEIDALIKRMESTNDLKELLTTFLKAVKKRSEEDASKEH